MPSSTSAAVEALRSPNRATDVTGAPEGKSCRGVTVSHSSIDAVISASFSRGLEHVVAEQQPQRRVLQAGDHQDGLGDLARVAGQVLAERLDQLLATPTSAA